MGRSVLVINSPEVAKDLLDKKGQIYSDRPRSDKGELKGQTEGTSFRPFDAGWKKQRRFLNQVLNPSAVRTEYYSLQAKRTYQWVFEFLDHPEGFDVWPSLKRMSGEIITTLGYGASREGDVDFIELNDKLAGTFADAVAGSISGAFFLLLKSLPPWMPGAQISKERQERRDFYSQTRDWMFSSVMKAREAGKPRHCYVEKMVSETENGPDPKGDAAAIAASAFSLYRAGSETIAIQIHTFILAMILFPEIQAKIQQELDAVIGPDRLPTIADRESLPYLHACMLEAMRWNPSVNTALPHRLMEDDIYNGYFIPAGTIVLVNIRSVPVFAAAFRHLTTLPSLDRGISQDPNLFPDPSKFDPTRHLPDSPHPAPIDPRDLIFGYGRRACPGNHFATQEIWIAVATILWGFSIEKKPGAPEPKPAFDMGIGGFVKPFECVFKPRAPHVHDRLAQALAGFD
ncbi:hypothetical protein FRC00_007376 [Tulasnella sp. 408]|nr:hypothetical protein FRC00_007376 [Tulasnella sp. 408]